MNRVDTTVDHLDSSQEDRADEVRAKLAVLDIVEADIAAAVSWARQSAVPSTAVASIDN